MNRESVLFAALVILSLGQLHAQSGYPWSKVDTVTSGPGDDFNPVLISNDGRLGSQRVVRMLFDRQTAVESQIVARSFQVTAARWDTSDIILSRSSADRPQKKPAYAEASYYSPEPPLRRLGMAAWQHWTGTRWEILYSSLPAPDSAWTAPLSLLSDTVDNTEPRIQPFRDSLFIVTWRRGSAVMALFKTPAGTTPAETLAVGNDDSSAYDLSSRTSGHATLIWTSRVDGNMTAISRFIDWATLEPTPPETLHAATPVYNPRLLSTWLGDPFFLCEARVFSTWQVFSWQGSRFGGNISTDETADNLRCSAYTVPVITKSVGRPKGTFYPFDLCVYEKVRPGDSVLVFLPAWGQGDTIRSPGYNRNARVGSSMIWIAPDVYLLVVWESNRSGRSHIYSRLVRVFIGAVDEPPGTPAGFALMQNYPNPFNPSSVIEYVIPRSSYVTIVLYDLLGRVVRTLVSGEQGVGSHTVRLEGAGLSSGVYIYRLRADGLTMAKKLVVLR